MPLAKNVYVKEIIKELTNKCIFNRGKPFAKNTIHNMLKNEKYSGTYHYKEETFDNIYHQIISKNLFELVKKKNEDNQYGSHSPFVNYILRKK